VNVLFTKKKRKDKDSLQRRREKTEKRNAKYVVFLIFLVTQFLFLTHFSSYSYQLLIKLAGSSFKVWLLYDVSYFKAWFL
jgi:hypothetical protein